MSAAALLGLGGATGAVCRYLVGLAVPGERFPCGTLVVNVLGSFLLGIVVFGPFGDGTALVVGTGFCGAFTTFSSFGFQTVELWERGRPAAAAANAIVNLVVCVVSMGLAWLLVG